MDVCDHKISYFKILFILFYGVFYRVAKNGDILTLHSFAMYTVAVTLNVRQAAPAYSLRNPPSLYKLIPILYADIFSISRLATPIFVPVPVLTTVELFIVVLIIVLGIFPNLLLDWLYF